MSNFRRPAQSRRLQLPGLSLHMLDWPGAATPVVLLHPNRTNARVWDFVVDASRLANRFLAPDARGHGLSDYPEAGYAYDDYLGDLRALFDAEGLKRVHLVGAATGGNLALLLASQSPQMAASLTVVDPGVSLDPQLSARVRDQMVREFRFDSLAEARSRMPFSKLWSEAMKDHYSSHSFVEQSDGRYAWRYHPPGAVSTEHLLETPIWDRIRVACPTLIIRGSASDVFPRANMERLAALIPGARTAEVDADHRVPQDNPAALAALIDNFVGSL
ncbi:MAG: alpha/beta fold hydrolase [Burkholderiales bacterium]